MVAIPLRHEEELTGRARARPGWFGRLVLQVEVLITSYSACPPRPGADRNAWRELMRSQGTQRTHWRDATWDDLQARRRDFKLLRPGLIEPPEPWPRVVGVNPRPTYPRPPAPPGPPPTGAGDRSAKP